MQTAPIPENENQRLISLHKIGLLDTSPEKRFDRITQTATRIFCVPISTLTLVDAKREWFKSCQGLPKREGDRAISFCGHALLSNSVFVIPDTKKDKRFADNPMVTGKPFLRFYAGVPVMSADGQRVGVFCIKDIKPREFSKDDEEALKGLAFWAEVEINSHNLSIALDTERKMRLELQLQVRKLHELDNSQKSTEKAMLNVLDDLEVSRNLLEIEKAKDEAMLISIGEGIIAVDSDRKVLVINRAAEELLGWKLDEVKGKILTSLPLSDENGNILPLDKRPTFLALTENKQVRGTYYFVKKDKTRFPIAIVVTPIILNGKTIGAIDTFRDITREMEIDRAKSEFVSLASHQLRTPLGVIKWYLEALKCDDYFVKAPARVQEYADEIYKSNERVLSLVRNLLSVSRIEQGRIKNDPKLVDVIQEIKEIVGQMQIIAGKKKITLHMVIPDQAISSISIDILRFHEVIENLIVNAIEYTEVGGKITVTIKMQGDTFFVSVQDTGIGISESDQKKLFNKFFRSEKASGFNAQGSGLGLYVVKSYVEGWGGEIMVESEEGKGSTFTISLPI